METNQWFPAALVLNLQRSIGFNDVNRLSFFGRLKPGSE
jgi:hypothetical protein